MEMVTRYAGKAHISAEDWAELNRGIAGEDSYAFPVGKSFEATLISNNLLKIYDGCGIMQGRHVRIPAGQSEEVAIQNGTQGEKRIDLVVERYTKNEDTKVETSETILIKGTPAVSNPKVPGHIEGDIRAGDMIADWPLYEVELDGINVVEVRPVFKALMNMSTVNDYLAELESRETSSNGEWTVVKHRNGWTELHITAQIYRASTEAYSLALNFPDGIQLRKAQTFITPGRNGWNVANYYHNNDNQENPTIPISRTNLVFSAKNTQALTYFFSVMVCGFEI